MLRRLLHVAEDLLDAPPVFEEVLLEERDDLALEAPDHVLRRGEVHQVAVPEHVVPVEQRLDPRVHRLQERPEVDPPEVLGKELGPRHHLAEGEAPPQRRVHEGDRPVGRVHRPDDEEVRRDAEALAAVGQLRFLLVPPSQPLAWLEERDELVERLREVRAVDLVDDEDAVRGLATGVPRGVSRSYARAMGLVSRRVMQQLLWECEAVADTSELIRRLNGDDALARLAADYEVILLNALSKLGRVRYEPALGGARRADLLFEPPASAARSALVEITAVSDRDAHKENPVAEFQKELIAFARDLGLEGTGLGVRYSGAREGPLGDQKMRLFLPAKSEIRRFARKREIRGFLENIRSVPGRPWKLSLPVPPGTLELSYSPLQGFTTAAMPSFTLAYSVRRNPVANRLEKKVAQLRQSGFEGAAGVMLCDAGCQMVREFEPVSHSIHISTSEVLEHCFKRFRRLTFVTLVTVGSQHTVHSAHRTPTPRIGFRSTTFVNRFARHPLSEEVRDALDRIPEMLPPVEAEPTAALAHYESHLRHQGLALGSYVGSTLAWDYATISISSRAACEVLAGLLDSSQLFIPRSSTTPPSVANLIAAQLANGRTLASARVEKRQFDDDDVLVLEFRGPDPALSRLRTDQRP